VFLVALAPKLDTDLWWHMLDGQYITTRHAVPVKDYLSFTFAGRAWVDHEWLADVLLYACYRLAGLWGTIVVFAAVICATFGLVYRRMAITGVNRMLALFVLAAAFVASSATWGARPQMLTLLFLAVFGFVLDRWSATRKRGLLLVVPLVTVLWTNVHGGWVLGLALLVLTLVGELCNRLTRHDGAWSAGDLNWFGGTIAATVVAAALNPAGLHEVLYPLAWILPTLWSNVLSEWVSTDFHQPVSMVFEAMLLGLLAAVFIARPRLNWTHLFVLLAFTHLALSQARNVAVWAVVVSPLVAQYFYTAIRTLARHRTPGTSASLRPGTERTLNVGLILAASVLYVVEAVHFINPSALRRNEATQFPAAAVAYMRTHGLPERTLASYSWGGYVLWKLYPRYRDFIDGRANTLFDDGILHDYLVASTAAPGWRTVLDHYRVGTVLVPPSSPLAQALGNSRTWREAYRDDVADVFVDGASGDAGPSPGS
jgi:hypothetical protein